MGLWGKVKGVFSRIGSGVKKGWNWLTSHKDDIAKVVDAGKQMLPEQYKQTVLPAIDKGKDMFTKTDESLRRFGII